MSNPNRRRRPVWCGDVDTTRPGGTWDVQDDGCCTPCKPPVPGCRPPMPQFPDCGYHIPPVQYVPGMNEQEQLANLNHKMNELIELFNCNTDKVYGAYEEVVRSAVCNDAFYKEITVESGYLADASTSYELVHIPYVDCACQPIYMEMGLAYNNTTNSGVTESVFDKALEVYADKILPAAERGFQGVAIWKGAPIYSGETHGDTRALIPGQCDYTLGVTENGYFKIYDTPNDRDNTGMIKTMRQDKVRNSMGCAVIIRGGEYVVDDNLSEMELPCTVMAMNYKTKERFILAIGKDNVASDITPEMIANLLKKYDVDVAALTSWGQQSYLLDKGQFSFMPTSADSDGIPTVPQSAAFWYITKRRHFHNDYVKEVAALTIQMGENLWYDELTSEAVDNLKLDFVDLRNDLEQEIQDRKDADTALGERIDTEIAERKAADTALDEKYAGEVARLDGKIDALSQRVTDEVARLDALIESTKETLNAKDVKEVKVTHEGTRDTYQVVLNDGTVLGVDMIVYNYDQLVQKLDSYATVEQRLDAEIQARKDADDALNALITAEQQARANGDTALAEQIASVKAELTELIHGNTTSITGLQTALDTLTQTVQSNYTSLNERVTSNAENIANLQGTYGALQATVAALNETVTGLQQSFASTEASFENVKQTVSNMQIELNQFQSEVEGKYLYVGADGYVKNTTIPLKTISTIENAEIMIGAVQTENYCLNGLSVRVGEERVDTAGFSLQAGEIPVVEIVSEQQEGSVSATLSTHGIKLYDSNGPLYTSFGWVTRGAETVGAIDVNSSTIYFEQLTNNEIHPEENGLIQIQGVASPGGDYDVANKKYVDTVGENLASEIVEIGGQFGSYLPLSGGTLTGPLDVAKYGGVPTKDGLYHYATNDYAIYSFYEDIERPARKFARFAVGEPVDDEHAATKRYVDTVGENLASEIAQVGGQFENYLPLTGGTVTGPTEFKQKVTADTIDMSGGPNGNIHNVMTVEFEITQQNPNGYAIMRNGTLQGFGAYNDSAPTPFAVGAPTQDYHAATKAYVDAADEGFLYVDGGRLYAHGTGPQDVLLDRLDFAPGGVESSGVVGIDCAVDNEHPILQVILGDNSGLGIIQAAKTNYEEDNDLMNLGAVKTFARSSYGATETPKTVFKVTSANSIIGTYLMRTPDGLWFINISGDSSGGYNHGETKLIGKVIDITVEVNDGTTMTITFSSAVNSIHIAKLFNPEIINLTAVEE